MVPNPGMQNQPLVSIITINYNQAGITCEMLGSLFQITYKNIEVIVVDNGSREDSPKIIKEKFPRILFIQSPENLGFAGGNNLGITQSHGKYILLLNNDTVVTQGFLEPLVNKMESDPTIGAVSPKIRFFFNPDTIQYAGLTPINPYTMRSRAIGFSEKDEGQYEKDAVTAYAHGAAMMFSKEAVQKIGLMSTSFFLYYEELDWGFRLRKAGYKIYYVHNSLIFHKESMTTGKISPLKTYYINRSRLLYMRRNVHGFRFLISILFQSFIAVPKNAAKYLVQGKTNLFKAYHNAICWHLKNMFNKKLHQHPFLNPDT